ncbi:MAG: nucleotidyl transferase AbiEii/AbiGii toxin family protein [Deltaproteobacteria bacterium]|nr:MAG: nucleotidyl transferase AbiEii/AbiGii toxin family protein [Deltaproteobacteria bacterium]
MKDILLKKLKGFASNEERYNFTREFLQELILLILDRKGYFRNLAFVGGTALRIIYDMPRFSEDLDFSLINKRGFSFPALLKTIKRELEMTGYSVEEVKSKGKTVIGEFIRFKGLLSELGLSKNKNEKLFVKLEIDSNPPGKFETEIIMVNRNFLYKVQCYKTDSLFANKLHAVLFRKYEKGRDYYDLLWFLTRKTAINYDLLSSAAAQTEKKHIAINADTLRGLLVTRLNQVDFGRLLSEVRPFLERKEESEYFKKEYFLKAVEKYFLI